MSKQPPRFDLIRTATAHRSLVEAQSRPMVDPGAAEASAAYWSQLFRPTKVMAPLLGIAPQTLRKHYSQNGSYFGVRPLKMPSGRLLWPADTIEQLAKINVGEGA